MYINEQWKDVVGYEFLYKISNYGRVVSLANRKKQKHKLLSCFKSNNGYLRYSFWKNGKMKHFSMHRLVALHFITNTYNKAQVNHKDGDKLNNYYKNLEWVDARENTIHAIENGLFCNYFGEKSRFAKLTESQVIEIYSLWKKSYTSPLELAIKFNISKDNIYNILRGRTWKHLKLLNNE